MANEEQYMVISVMAKDRPGIVAEITEGIGGLGGNLADLRESVLCGYFTMIFVAGFPEAVTTDEVEQALATASATTVSVVRHEGVLEPEMAVEDAYVLTAVGQDRAGLVAQVSSFCRDRMVNILDLASHVDGVLYTMMLKVDLSSIADLQQLRQELADFGTAAGLNIVLQHSEIFRATNEV